MSICTAAVVLGFAGSVAAAPAPATKKDPKAAKVSSTSTKTPKLSKWQQHVLEVLHDAAPGDEYFGRMKMSYLGINNTFHDDAIRAGAYTTDPHLISSLSFADDALSSWAKKYPNDPQLARSYFLAFQMYRKVYTQQYQQKAWDYAHVVIKKWPSSFFGKTLKKSLAVGFTEHYFATPVPCEVLIAAATPNASASPSASPSPTPTPVPLTGQPKLDILPVPCSTPIPTPTPIPLTSGSPLPIPSTSASPSPSPMPKYDRRERAPR